MSHPASAPLFKQPCEFIMGGAALDALPTPDYPEIAFAGRSNVGKSSLVNALTGRKTLVKISSTPGRTRELNFFLLGEKLMLVDLPGYGYAKAPRKDVARWNLLVRDYLTGRPNLRRVVMLIDARHGVKPLDEEIMKILDVAAVSYQLVLTKTDKISSDAAAQVQESCLPVVKRHAAAHPTVLATSAEKKNGLDALRGALAAFCAS